MTIIFEKPKPNFGKYVSDFEHNHMEKSSFVPYKTMWVYNVDFVDVNVKEQCVILSDQEQNKINSVPFNMFDNLCIE